MMTSSRDRAATASRANTGTGKPARLGFLRFPLVDAHRIAIGVPDKGHVADRGLVGAKVKLNVGVPELGDRFLEVLHL